MPSRIKRKQYTAKFKLDVLKMLDDDKDLSLRKCAIHNKIQTKMIREWRRKRQQLEDLCILQNMDTKGKNKKKRPHRYVRVAGGGGKTNPVLDTRLLEWFRDRSSKNLHIKDKFIGKKAVEISKGIEGLENFKGSNGFVKRFKTRHEFANTDLRNARRNVAVNEEYQEVPKPEENEEEVKVESVQDPRIFSRTDSLFHCLSSFAEDSPKMILLKIVAEMKSNEYIQDITDDEYVTTLLERKSLHGVGQNELYAFCVAYGKNVTLIDYEKQDVLRFRCDPLQNEPMKETCTIACDSSQWYVKRIVPNQVQENGLALV